VTSPARSQTPKVDDIYPDRTYFAVSRRCCHIRADLANGFIDPFRRLVADGTAEWLSARQRRTNPAQVLLW